MPVNIQLIRDRTHLGNLHRETLVFGLLALVGLDGHILQNTNLLLQVAFNVVALGVSNRLHSVLLSLQLADLLTGKCHLLLQLDNFLLELIDASLETERLLGAECRI